MALDQLEEKLREAAADALCSGRFGELARLAGALHAKQTALDIKPQHWIGAQ